MNWIGISNENEFYSQHYLSEIFSGDVRDVLETWAEQETQARETARANNQKEPDYRAPYTQLNSIWRNPTAKKTIGLPGRFLQTRLTRS